VIVFTGIRNGISLPGGQGGLDGVFFGDIYLPSGIFGNAVGYEGNLSFLRWPES
jgi:hypothetical protein